MEENGNQFETIKILPKKFLNDNHELNVLFDLLHYIIFGSYLNIFFISVSTKLIIMTLEYTYMM